MKPLRKRLFFALAVLAILGLIVYGFLPRPVAVEVAEVKRGALRVTVDEEGQVRVMDRYIVSAPIGGELVRVNLKVGDRVGQDELLTEIRPALPQPLDDRARAEAHARVRAATAAEGQAQARVERARAAHEFARIELERARQLRDTRVASERDLDLAVQNAEIASRELDASREAALVAAHEVEVAQTALEWSDLPPDQRSAQSYPVRSPVEGRVLRIFQESAAVVTPGAPILEIGDPTRLEVVIDVLSADAVRIAPQARALLEHWGGADALVARVRRVEPVAFTKFSALGVEEQRVNVIADLEDPPEAWAPLGDGYRVEARIVVTDRAETVIAPAGALFRHGESWAAFAVEEGRARFRRVMTGPSTGLETEIVEGLTPGERVILYPADQVTDGGRVETIER